MEEMGNEISTLQNVKITRFLFFVLLKIHIFESITRKSRSHALQLFLHNAGFR